MTTTLNVPAITGSDYTTVDEILALYPDADPARVAALIPIVTKAIDAQVCTPIGDPAPDAVRLAAAFLTLDALTATTGGDVISETIAGYSYRLSTPKQLTNALILRPGASGAAELLEPWLCGGAYQTSIWPGKKRRPLWPDDWWQRDLDTDDGGAP